MSDPSLAVQGAVVAALKAADVAGDRIYDRVPVNPTFPYITIGGGDTIGDDNDCWGASEVFVQVHVWSRTIGFPECKTIAGQVRDALSSELTLANFRNAVAGFLTTRHFRDPDGLTSHAVVEFRYLIDHDYT